MAVISMKQLLEAGVHFGHQTRKWNPKMKKYIFTARNDIHILNLEQASDLIDEAYSFVRDVVAAGKNVLFVGTKKQAQDAVKEEAERCGMFYVNTRWLGGTLTNFKTIASRIERLNKLNQMEKVGEFDLLPKKEVALLKQERDKLEKNLGGIKEMRTLPGVIFLVDPTIEHICVKEAQRLGIPTVAIVDTNADPSGITHVIPANDDAIRSVKLIASAIADAVIEAKEGTSMKREESEEEEKIDLEKALSELPAIEEEEKVEKAEEVEKAEDESVEEKKPAKKTSKAKKEEKGE
jgi:small subunit ribosomal protein S2